MILAIPVFNGLLKQTSFSKSVLDLLTGKIFFLTHTVFLSPRDVGSFFSSPNEKFVQLTRTLSTTIQWFLFSSKERMQRKIYKRSVYFWPVSSFTKKNTIWYWDNEVHIEVPKRTALNYRFITWPGFRLAISPSWLQFQMIHWAPERGNWFVFPFFHIIQKF